MSMHPSDTPIVATHSAKCCPLPYSPPDGRSFFLAVAAGPDGIIQLPVLRFSSEVSASEALAALIELGVVYAGYVCEDKRYLWRRKA